jgi:hypothetical protein
MVILKTILGKLRNPIILSATIGNIFGVVALLGFDMADLKNWEKIVTLAIQILIQLGVLTNDGQ